MASDDPQQLLMQQLKKSFSPTEPNTPFEYATYNIPNSNNEQEFQPDGCYGFPIDPNRLFRSDPTKDIDFALIYKVPVHVRDPELESGHSTPCPTGEGATTPLITTSTKPHGGFDNGAGVDQILIDARRQEEKQIKYRKNFHKSMKQLGLFLELDDFRASGDHLRVVKLHVPKKILLKWAEKFGFEKALKCDRKAHLERCRGAAGQKKKNMNKRVFDDFPKMSDDSSDDSEEEEEGEEKSGIFNWCDRKIFFILHGKDSFYSNMRKNYFPKIVKAPFVVHHSDKFLGFERSDFFSPAERSIVVYRILQQAVYLKEGNRELFGVDELVANGTYKAAYPLHDGSYEIDRSQRPKNHRQLLRFYWASFRQWNKNQPLNEIRNYFGEKIGMYFAWTGFYTQSLFIPAIMGTLVFGYGIMIQGDDFISTEICQSGKKYRMCPLCEDDGCEMYYIKDICKTAQQATSVNNPATLGFCIFMSIWVAYFLEMWKRKEAMLGHIWGTLKSQTSTAQIRPTYTQNCDKWKYNPRTQRNEPCMSSKKRYPRYITTFVSILVILACVIIFALAVIVYDLAVYLALSNNPAMQKYAKWLSSVSAGVMSLTLIIIMSKYYTKFAITMTEWENHKTQFEYENNLTIRRYIFEVFNFYSTLVYIGFFKGKINGYPGHYPRVFGVKMEDCPPGGCISELATQMAIILAGKQFIFSFSQFVIPIIISNKNSCIKAIKPNLQKKNNVVKKVKTPWERDYQLAETRDVFAEYLEMVIQYGFVTIFVAAFPLAPLLALVNNILEMRLDSFKFVAQLRRPIGFKSKDIGIWSDILAAVGKIAVVCNAFIIAFSSDFLPMMLFAMDNREKNAKRKNMLSGYVNFSLAVASPDMTGHSESCR